MTDDEPRSLLDMCMWLRQQSGRSTTSEDRERIAGKICALSPTEFHAERAAIKGQIGLVRARMSSV